MPETGADQTEVTALRARVNLLTRLLKGPDRLSLPEGVTLTPMVEALLAAIVAGNGDPVSTARLHAALYMDAPNGGADLSAIKVMVSKMRARLEGHLVIRTRTGFGYYLDPQTILKLTGKEPW